MTILKHSMIGATMCVQRHPVLQTETQKQFLIAGWTKARRAMGHASINCLVVWPSQNHCGLVAGQEYEHLDMSRHRRYLETLSKILDSMKGVQSYEMLCNSPQT